MFKGKCLSRSVEGHDCGKPPFGIPVTKKIGNVHLVFLFWKLLPIHVLDYGIGSIRGFQTVDLHEALQRLIRPGISLRVRTEDQSLRRNISSHG
jgi:hypothetical protein